MVKGLVLSQNNMSQNNMTETIQLLFMTEATCIQLIFVFVSFTRKFTTHQYQCTTQNRILVPLRGSFQNF